MQVLKRNPHTGVMEVKIELPLTAGVAASETASRGKAQTRARTAMEQHASSAAVGADAAAAPPPEGKAREGEEEDEEDSPTKTPHHHAAHSVMATRPA